MTVKLYHAYISAVSDGSNTQLVRPSNWNAALQYGAGGGPTGTDALVPEALSANRTYFVRTDGNDSNTGLVNNSGGAFLTIQKGIDTVAGLDVNGFDVTIQIADGTYSVTSEIIIKNYFGTTASAFGVSILGNSGTPSNVVVTSSTVGLFASESFKPWNISGVKLATSAGGVTAGVYAAGNAIVYVGAVDFGACARHMSATYGGQIRMLASYTISGGATVHAIATFGGLIFLASWPSYTAITATLTGTPNFSVNTVYATNLGIIESFNVTFSGAATGSRYNVASNAVIQTYGGGANYFPGDSAGTSGSGGVYA